MASFWDSVSAAAQGALAEVEQWGLDLWNAAKVFFSDLEQSVLANGGKVLMDAAIAGVTAAETTGGSGADKFNAAKASIVSALKTEGLPVVDNAVHGAIEAAVATLKASQSAQTVGVAAQPATAPGNVGQ